MTFEEAIGVKNCNVDIKTGETISHKEKYDRMIDLLGYERVKLCLPYTTERLVEAYKKDIYFNNLPMKNWDLMSGFTRDNYGRVTRFRSLLTTLYRDHNIICYSNAEGVSLLKHCACRLVEEYNKENNLC